MLLTSAVISGLGLGSMYGLIALGFHVTYVVSNTVNFSQGSAMMLGAVLGYTFAVTFGWPLPLAAMTALAACALVGAVIERTLVRPFSERGQGAFHPDLQLLRQFQPQGARGAGRVEEEISRDQVAGRCHPGSRHCQRL